MEVINVRTKLPSNDGKYGDSEDYKSMKSLKSKRKLIHSYSGHTK